MPVDLMPSSAHLSANAHAQRAVTPARAFRLRARSVAVACAAAAVLSACTRTSEPTGPAPSSAPAAATGGDVVVWADAGLKPLLDQTLVAFQAQSKRSVQVHYGDSAQLRQGLRSSTAGAVQVYLGLAVPPSDNDVLVVHPGDVKSEALGLGDGPWSRTQWLWQDRMCSVSRIPVGPGTVMGQWQRKGVVLAGDFSGSGPSEPVARVLVTAEGLQPGLRETLLGKLRQWHTQSPVPEAVAAVAQNHAHMAIAPCAQGRTGTLPAALQLTTLSPALDVRLSYGMALRQNAGDAAQQLARHLQSGATQAVATQLGMTAPTR